MDLPIERVPFIVNSVKSEVLRKFLLLSGILQLDDSSLRITVDYTEIRILFYPKTQKYTSDVLVRSPWSALSTMFVFFKECRNF